MTRSSSGSSFDSKATMPRLSSRSFFVGEVGPTISTLMSWFWDTGIWSCTTSCTARSCMFLTVMRKLRLSVLAEEMRPVSPCF